jgi:hypothetical protein
MSDGREKVFTSGSRFFSHGPLAGEGQMCRRVSGPYNKSKVSSGKNARINLCVEVCRENGKPEKFYFSSFFSGNYPAVL